MSRKRPIRCPPRNNKTRRELNFLAHLYLAGDDQDLVVGQMLADFLERGWREQVSPGVLRGVALHQQTDLFTDRHPVFKRSRGRLPQPMRRYAGIIVDVFYDHVLARHWPLFHPSLPLEQFAASRYRILTARSGELTGRLRQALPSIIRHDWLTSYRELDGIERALNGLSRRLRRDNPLAAAHHCLRRDFDDFEQDFFCYFPQLEWFAANLRRDL